MLSGDNPVYLGNLANVSSTEFNWTIAFREAGTFNLDVNASGYYDGVTPVEKHRSATITVFEREENDLAVWLETPIILEFGKSVLLNATVYNVGLNDETNVELRMLMNGSIANSTVIPELLTGSSHSISYLWTPMIVGTYNITAYAPPVAGENIIIDNVKSTVINPPPDILVVADDDALFSAWQGTSLPEFELALNEADFDYFVWNETTMGNPSLEFLLNFRLVIWTCGDHWSWAVDPTDAETLEAYLSQGGTVLLEGEDIGYDHYADDFMVNVAHAVCQIDDTGAPGLTVMDATHPITVGLPTSFNWTTDPPYDDGVYPTNGGVAVINYTGTSWTAVTAFNGSRAMGDVNGDGIVDIFDVVTLSMAFGSIPDDSSWNMAADLNNDNVVDIFDVVLLAQNFGKEVGSGSVVYYAFPLHCLAQPEINTLVNNAVNWLLTAQGPNP